MQHPAFLPTAFLPLTPLPTHPTRTALRNRPKPTSHPHRPRAPKLALQETVPSPSPPPERQTRSLFTDEEDVAFWNSIDVAKAFGPITDAEKAALREKLPRRVAEFLIRRADAAIAQRTAQPSDATFIGRMLNDLPPDVTDWERPENAEFRDYVYETATGPPAFRRRGSSLFGGGDGLADVEDRSNVVGENGERKGNMVYSLFVGNVGSVDEQASRVGYSLLVVAAAYILFKLIMAVVSFFVSFTFSFLAIFALSAGIFVVFFLLRF